LTNPPSKTNLEDPASNRPEDSLRTIIRRAVFLLGAGFAVTPWCSPPIALAVGIGLALIGLTAFESEAKKYSRLLIQACVVVLGLRMDLGTVLHTAREGLLFAAGTIVGTMALGFAAGRALKLGREITLLISSGTAICGGSAIAAVGSAINAAGTSMAVATGTVFLLNAVALWLFPIIGHALDLSQTQFGTWAGVAIHDLSSVVGAATAYSRGYDPSAHGNIPSALDTANVIKLSRVIWILPITVFAAWVTRRAERGILESSGTGAPRRPGAPIPWFIALFLLTSAMRSLIPALAGWESQIKVVAASGFALALFLIGTGLSRKAIASVGWRAMALGVLLWVCISVTALVVVKSVVR